MQPYGDNFILAIPVYDVLLHTEARQFCGDPTCGCHDNPALIDPVNQQYLDGLLTAKEASRTIQGRQV